MIETQCPPLTHHLPFLPEREWQGQCHIIHSFWKRTDNEMVTCGHPFACPLLVGRGQSESVVGRGRRQFPLPVPFCGKDGGNSFWYDSLD